MICEEVGVITHGGPRCSRLRTSSLNLRVVRMSLALMNIISSFAVIIKKSRSRQIRVHNILIIEPKVILGVSDVTTKEIMATHGLKI
jgi:hypothetical protein